jgi:hypothetical protein
MRLLIHTLIVSLMVGSTNADRMIRAIFNNGVAPTAETFCDTPDNAHIDNVFKPIKRARYLRETAATTANATFVDIEMTDTHVDRELWPAYCKDNCAGYVSGTCRATNCVGYRKKDRRQTQTLTCDDHKQMVNTDLDALMTKVSSTCAAYLNPANRKVECYDDVIYGVVENFVLWKSQSVNKKYSVTSFSPGGVNPMEKPFTMVSNLKSLGTVTDGFNVCHYDRINIEAVVNPCVKFINATLTHPNGFTATRTEGDIPYTVFGDSKNTPMGRELPLLGTYTFSALPDNFEYKKKSITFNVVQC